MREINESDWKVLRQLHSAALERFCKQVLLEVKRVNSDHTQTFHERYLEIWKVLKQRDEEMAQAFDDLKRSRALTMIAGLHKRGLLTEKGLTQFSEETRGVIDGMLRVRRK